MNAVKKSTFNMLFIVKKSKLLKNGEAPIRLRITVNSSKSEIMIKRSTPVNLWVQSKQCSKSTNYVAKELNHYLETVKATVLKIHRKLEMDGCIITANLIADRYLGKGEVKKSLIQIFKEHNEKCKELINIDYKPSTIQKFNTYLQHLERYIASKYNKTDILLAEIKSEFISNYKHYLKVDCGLNNNSAIKNLKALKKIIRIALANEWMKKDPFTNMKFKLDEVEVDFLTLQELESIINKNLAIKRIAQVRDIFVFCCYTGLAFTYVKTFLIGFVIKINNYIYILKSEYRWSILK